MDEDLLPTYPVSKSKPFKRASESTLVDVVSGLSFKDEAADGGIVGGGGGGVVNNNTAVSTKRSNFTSSWWQNLLGSTKKQPTQSSMDSEKTATSSSLDTPFPGSRSSSAAAAASKSSSTATSSSPSRSNDYSPTRMGPSSSSSSPSINTSRRIDSTSSPSSSSSPSKPRYLLKSGLPLDNKTTTTTQSMSSLNIKGLSASMPTMPKKKSINSVSPIKKPSQSHYGPNYVPARGPSAEPNRRQSPSPTKNRESPSSAKSTNKSPTTKSSVSLQSTVTSSALAITSSSSDTLKLSTPYLPPPPNSQFITSSQQQQQLQLQLQHQQQQAPAAVKKLASKEDDERNKRHSEVVNILSGKKKLPESFTSKFRIGEVLGDGAFGFVLTADCLTTGKEVAVKFIIKDKVPKELWDKESNLPVEIHMLSILRHPNIIRYLGHYDVDEYVILVSELHGTQWDVNNPELNAAKNPGLRESPRVKTPVNPDAKLECSPLFRLTPEQEKAIKRRTSCDLFECIDAHKQIPEEISKKIVAQIALAVHYLQERGIVHRDLKDENVVIDSDYNVKIVDFGSASKIPQSRNHYFTKFNGTAHFASPEIASGNSYRGPEAEIWSLGVLLFTIVCGENPFQNRNEIIKGKYSFPCKISPDCQNLIARMLTYNEKNRATIQQILTHRWLQPEVARLQSMYSKEEH